MKNMILSILVALTVIITGACGDAGQNLLTASVKLVNHQPTLVKSFGCKLSSYDDYNFADASCASANGGVCDVASLPIGKWTLVCKPVALKSLVPLRTVEKVIDVKPSPATNEFELDFLTGGVVVILPADGGLPPDSGTDSTPPQPDSGVDGTTPTPDSGTDSTPPQPDSGTDSTQPTPDSGVPPTGTGLVTFKCVDSVTHLGVACTVTEVNLPAPKSCVGNVNGVCQLTSLPLAKNLRFLAELTGYATASWSNVVLTDPAPAVKIHTYVMVKTTAP